MKSKKSAKLFQKFSKTLFFIGKIDFIAAREGKKVAKTTWKTFKDYFTCKKGSKKTNIVSALQEGEFIRVSMTPSP
jgi:hypothetical protein